MKATAKLNKLRVSARKARLVADLIRGKQVNQALDLLKHDSRTISMPISFDL